jgi:hypothetical protein
MADLAAASQPLRTVFGFGSFRAGQAEIIETILSGRDVLAVMPTGSGKSLCYQLPALLRDGLTIVVSPLIALMRNQVAQLRSYGWRGGRRTTQHEPQRQTLNRRPRFPRLSRWPGRCPRRDRRSPRWRARCGAGGPRGIIAAHGQGGALLGGEFFRQIENIGLSGVEQLADQFLGNDVIVVDLRRDSGAHSWAVSWTYVHNVGPRRAPAVTSPKS